MNDPKFLRTGTIFKAFQDTGARIAIVTATDEISGRMQATRGKARIFRIFRFLQGVKPEGRTDLGEALKTFVAQHKRRGLAVLLTDLGSRNGTYVCPPDSPVPIRLEEGVQHFLEDGTTVHLGGPDASFTFEGQSS